MLDPNVDLPSAIAFGVLEGLAIVLTLLRLLFRLRIQRFWWEDAWAAVALTCAVVFVASAPAFFINYNNDLVLVISWINACMFISVIWSVRVSLVCSIIRITASLFMRRMALVVAACMFIFCAATFGLETWWCGTTVSDQPRSDCTLPSFIIIFEVATNCFADCLTLGLSLKLLWKVRLPPRQRKMVLCLFSASRFLCMFALPHSISQLVASRAVQNILTNLELTVFLIVCNLIVAVTYVYRFFLRSPIPDFESDEDFTTAPRRDTDSLTTVDLESVCASDVRSISQIESSYLDSSSSTR